MRMEKNCVRCKYFCVWDDEDWWCGKTDNAEIIENTLWGKECPFFEEEDPKIVEEKLDRAWRRSFRKVE